MIAFSPLTLKDIYDRVDIMLSQHRTAINLDYGTVVMFINRSVREALVKTLAYKDHAYINRFDVTTGAPAAYAALLAAGIALPANYIKYKRVMLTDGEEGFKEARYVDIREFFTLSDWYGRQSWDMATVENPIFTIWGPQDTTPGTPLIQSFPRIYIAPYTNAVFTNQTGTVPSGFTYYTGTQLSGYMEAYMAPEDLVNAADQLPLPYEFEELIINLTIMRCLAKMESTSLEFYRFQSSDEMSKLRKRYLERTATSKMDLEAFVDVIPENMLQQIESAGQNV